MNQHKFSRSFYIICAVGLLSLIITERITPHKAYASFFAEKAQRAIERQQFKKAKQQYRLAFKADPERPNLYCQFGEFLVDQGSYGEAIPYLQMATYLGNYKNQISFYLLGMCYYRLGFYKRAQASFESGVTMTPGYAKCRYYLILSLLKLDKKETIPYHLKKLQEVDPDLARSLELMLGNVKQ